jgi:hypothetical protein
MPVSRKKKKGANKPNSPKQNFKQVQQNSTMQATPISGLQEIKETNSYAMFG